jgi:hypothetical protein
MLDRKRQEISDLELQLEKAKTYIEALQDSMRLLPKSPSDAEVTLRPGTALDKTREVLKTTGRPMHITEILKALNQPIDKKHKLSLSGSLSTYVRNAQIFTRPAPNTFGLIEMNNKAHGESGVEDLPEDFGGG